MDRPNWTKAKGEIKKVYDIFFDFNTKEMSYQDGFKIKQNTNCFPLVSSLLANMQEGYRLDFWLQGILNQVRYNNNGTSKPLKIYDDRLYDYQNNSVANLMLMNNVGIFNQQRTGKTPTVLIAVREKNFKKTIITLKASLLFQWREEIITWLGYEPILVNDPPRKRKELYKQFFDSDKEEILLISYDTLKIDWSNFQDNKYDCIIADEADFLRNNSVRTRNLTKVREQCEFAWLLTGTPVVNGKEDIVPLIAFLYPRISKWNLYGYFFFMGKQKFQSGGVKINFLFKSSYEAILQEWLELFTLNTKREEVWDLIPPVKKQVIHIPMKTQQYKLYDSMLNYYVMGKKGNEVAADGVLATITRLRQIMLDPRIIEGLDSKVKGAKTEEILQYVKDFHKTKKIIIFGDYTRYLNLIHSELDKLNIESGLFTGQIKHKERDETKNNFQNGDLNVILVNTEAGAKGLTLSNGDVIIFAQNSFSYILREQAEDRFIAQDDRPREIIDFVTDFPNKYLNIEEVILEAQSTKKSETEVINNWKQMLTDLRNKEK